MDSEDVGATDETIESQQVLTEIEFVFYDFLTKNDWLFPKQLIQLARPGSLTASEPNYLAIPDDVWNIHQVRYDITDTNDNHTKIKTIDYKDPESFLKLVQNRNETNSNIEIVKSKDAGVEMFIVNDDDPDWWTSFDDEFLIFDKYNSNVDSTLQNSKSQALAKVRPVFPSKDSDNIPVPEWVFPAFEEECRVACHFYFKNTENRYDSQRSFSGLSRQRRLSRTTENVPQKVKRGRR